MLDGDLVVFFLDRTTPPQISTERHTSNLLAGPRASLCANKIGFIHPSPHQSFHRYHKTPNLHLLHDEDDDNDHHCRRSYDDDRHHHRHPPNRVMMMMMMVMITMLMIMMMMMQMMMIVR